MVTVRTSIRAWDDAYRVRFQPTGSIVATDVYDAIIEVESDVAGSLQPITNPTVISATGNVPATALNVQTNQVAPITLTLPLSTAWASVYAKYGIPLSILDISGNASTNNVTINFSGGETSSGLTSVKITGNYGIRRFIPKSGGGWVSI